MSEPSPLISTLREKVRAALTASPAFNALTPEKRLAVANGTVRSLAYILGGADGQSQPDTVTLGGNAAAFAGQPAPLRPLAPNAPPRMDVAAAQGGEALGNLVRDINFPAFVGGLVDGVFNSIVTSSIKQMEAYAELVKNVTKTVDQYMKDNVSTQSARDYLMQQYPDHLEMDSNGDAPKLKPKSGADDTNMPDFMADLGLPKAFTQLDDDNVEQQLVPAARRRMAMDRQQMLATMVMMGVNRLVVTDGTIEASCLFQLDARDTRVRDRTRTGQGNWSSNRSSESGANINDKWTDGAASGQNWSEKYSGDANWYRKGSSSNSANFSVTTVDTNKNEDEIKLHAQLSGKVRVNFKSDYFPMERMIDALQINQIRDKAPASAPAPQQPLPPPIAPPPLPALPAAPGR